MVAAGAKPVVLILQDDHHTFFKPPAKGKVPESWLKRTDIPDLKGSGRDACGPSLRSKTAISEIPSLHSWNSAAHERTSEATLSLHCLQVPARSLGPQSTPTSPRAAYVEQHNAFQSVMLVQRKGALAA